jgi:hypothetical protein
MHIFHVKLKKMVSFNTESRTHSGMKKWDEFQKDQIQDFFVCYTRVTW